MANPETTDPVWTGSARLYWRADDFGHEECALYVGGLQIGSIMHSPKMYAAGGVQRVNEKPYRSWITTDSDGKSLGWFLTKQEAKFALKDAAVQDLRK